MSTPVHDLVTGAAVTWNGLTPQLQFLALVLATCLGVLTMPVAGARVTHLLTRAGRALATGLVGKPAAALAAIVRRRPERVLDPELAPVLAAVRAPDRWRVEDRHTIVLRDPVSGTVQLRWDEAKNLFYLACLAGQSSTFYPYFGCQYTPRRHRAFQDVLAALFTTVQVRHFAALVTPVPATPEARRA